LTLLFDPSTTLGSLISHFVEICVVHGCIVVLCMIPSIWVGRDIALSDRESRESGYEDLQDVRPVQRTVDRVYQLAITIVTHDDQPRWQDSHIRVRKMSTVVEDFGRLEYKPEIALHEPFTTHG
jgi:hypothetical protein